MTLEFWMRLSWLLGLAAIIAANVSAWTFSARLHLVFGVSGLLFYFFVNLLLIFYFVGTGTWMKDQAQRLFRVDPDRAQKVWANYQAANRLKALSMPVLTLGLLVGMFLFILGAGRQVGAVPTWVHPTLGYLFSAINFLGTPLVFRAIRENVKHLDSSSEEIDLLMAT